MMKTTTALSLVLAAALALGSGASAATKDYQVTGPVLEVTPSMIAVQKGKERWELARDTGTKSDAEPKVGDKVTVHYTMSATKIEMKADKQARAEDKKSAKSSPSPSGEKK